MSGLEFLDNGGMPIAVAHRGGAVEAERAGIPEYSLQALHLVSDLGYRYIETDVRATEDGELYTWHGQGLERLDKSRPLKKRDVEAIRINGAPVVPLFSDVLEEFPDIHFSVDLKNWPAIEPLANAIVAAKAFNRVSVSGFSQGKTDEVARLIYEKEGSKICTGLGVRGVTETVKQAYFSRRKNWKAPNPLAVLPRTLSSEKVIEALHSGGAEVFTWVVNDPAEMEHFLDIGVDGIYTDEPTLLKDVLQKRQQWH